jgi:putative membrane protein
VRKGALEHIGLVAWGAGILASIGLTVWLGIADVGNAVASVSWGMPFVMLARVATISVAGAGWWLLLPASEHFKLRAAVLLRFIREAANTLLPLTQVGGDVVGARLSTFWAVPTALAAASIIIDVLMQAVTQFLFAALGLVMLVALAGDTTVTWIAATGLALAAPMLGGFYLAQRRSAHRILHLALSHLKRDGDWRFLGTLDAIYENLSVLYARRNSLLASGQVHFVGWLLGTAEVWIALRFMGLPVTVSEALVIESLMQAVRGAAFAIPGAFGAQEAGLILLCGIFQIPPDQALALSLIKRAADLVVGVPGLVLLRDGLSDLTGNRVKSLLWGRVAPSRCVRGGAEAANSTNEHFSNACPATTRRCGSAIWSASRPSGSLVIIPKLLINAGSCLCAWRIE